MFLPLAPEPSNLLRNGSFEGTTKYWYGETALDAGVHGRYALRTSGIVYSAPFPLVPGRTVTLAAWVRADRPGRIHLTLTPADRDAMREPYRAFWGKSGVSAEAATEWRRVAFEIPIPADLGLPAFGKPDRRSWMLFLQNEPNGAGKVWIDGVTVAYGAGGDGYVPSASVEASLRATNLPGYAQRCNILDAHARVDLRACLFNPSDRARRITLRWQTLDYTGIRPLAPSQDVPLTIPPLGTATALRSIRLPGTGLQIARALVLGPQGERLDSSDQPLTCLAAPKAASALDPRERFGGTITAGQPDVSPLIEAARAIGLRWSRWYPQNTWAAVQPDGPDRWSWPDARIDALRAKGIGMNLVLFDVPKWARGAGWLPKDMEDWKPGDPRWSDLSVTTRWDAYVKALAARYRGRGYAYEPFNEPEFGHFAPDLYTAFFRRTARLVRGLDPTAKIVHNSINGGPDGISRAFLDRGGANDVDAFSFHNYTLGGYLDEAGIRDMRNAFRAAGRKGGDVEVWMNEGWAHFPSSEDYAAPTRVVGRTATWVADMATCNVAETLAAGMARCIVFIMGYDDHGQSWWDWSGDGTTWYDADGQPTVAVGAFNVLSDRLGLSHRVASIRPEGAVLHVFQDERHGAGVAVAWSTKGAATLALPQGAWSATDLMGNPLPLGTRLSLPVEGRPVFLALKGASGEAMARALRALEPPLPTLEGPLYGLTPRWYDDGAFPVSYAVKGNSIWTLGRVWPPDPKAAADYAAFPTWDGSVSRWVEPASRFGGNPVGGVNPDGSVTITAVGQRSGGDMRASYLAFTAPQEGTYDVSGAVRSFRWEGTGDLRLDLVRIDRAAHTVEAVGGQTLRANEAETLRPVRVALRKGEELALRLTIDAFYTAGNVTFERLTVRRKAETPMRKVAGWIR